MAERMRAPAATQGLYCLATGIWPLVSIRTFEAVTGPKQDRWLVKTVGLLAAATGSVLALSAARGPTRDARALGVASAAAFSAVDVVYVANGTLRPVYLLDAVVELGLHCRVAAYGQ